MTHPMAMSWARADSRASWPPDFLLFMPTHAAGLRAVLSYYTSTVKMTAEGDVHVSDEAISGLGTTLDFLKTSLFGAITQLVTSPRPHTSTLPHDYMSTTALEPGYNSKLPPFDEDEVTVEGNDPYIPTKPARRKEASHKPELLTLTDLVPDVGYFIAGAVSGITSRTATAPLDRLKTYLIAQTGNAKEAIQKAKSGAPVQATKQGASTMWMACKELWAAGGMRSLFAGM